MERPPRVGYSLTEVLGNSAYSHVEIARQATLETHTDIHFTRKNFRLDSGTLIRILIIVLNFNLSIFAYHDYHQGTIAGIRFDE